MKSLALVILALAALTGCDQWYPNEKAMTHTITVDDRFSPEQVESIILAVEAWRASLPGTFTAEIVIGRTKCEQKFAIHFVAAGEDCLGVGRIGKHGRPITAQTSIQDAATAIIGTRPAGPALQRTATHELGHYLGAHHLGLGSDEEGHNVMTDGGLPEDICIAPETLSEVCSFFSCGKQVPSC